MDRRKSIKALLIGTAASGVFIEACKNSDKRVTEETTLAKFTGSERMQEENEHYKKVAADKFFDQHELATIAVLTDIIIPKDAVSGSASDAGVTDFIEFIVKDIILKIIFPPADFDPGKHTLIGMPNGAHHQK